MADGVKCLECGKDASVLARWMASGMEQEAEFCNECMSRHWKQFGSHVLFEFSEIPEGVDYG